MALRVLVLRAAGTNCDAETAHAWRLVGTQTETVHVKRLIERPALLRSFQALTIPGGFSYGDDIAAGTILASQLRQSAGDELRRFIDDGKLVLGICNGFQVLVKTGLLPDPKRPAPIVTLAFNGSGRFEARWVRLRTSRARCRFLPPDTTIELPVAHAEGRLTCRDDAVPQSLIDDDRACLIYIGKDDRPCGYPGNPNGSAANIAGLTDASGQVLGLMPHPERFVDPTQHPLWARGRSDRAPDGLMIFKSAAASFST